MPKASIVVGARGKVGSTLTGLLRANGYDPVAVNRGDGAARDRAFRFAGPGSPVWIATTTDALGAALQETVPAERLDDCIVLQNGVLGSELRGAAAAAAAAASSRSPLPPDGRRPRRRLTRVVLYLRAGDGGGDGESPWWEDGGGRTLVRPGGAHSEHAARILPGARVARGRAEFCRAARDKLAWCCAAWLVSQAGDGGGGGGSSLGEVARGALGEELRALAAELAPAAAAAVASEEEEEEDGGEDEEDREDEEDEPAASCAAAVLAYCRSIGGAVPSRELALREWPWRNGAVLRAVAASREAGGALPLPLHARWCERAGVVLPPFSL